MADKVFSDIGMRYRLNKFDALDSWIPLFPTTLKRFYDVFEFSTDTYVSPTGHPILAQIFFRLDVS